MSKGIHVDSERVINELKVIEPILMNIKKVGDLTIISKKDLYQIVQDNENI